MSDIKIISIAGVALVFYLLLLLGGCSMEIGGTTTGVEVCTGDTTECAEHDESTVTTTTETTEAS
ncbi:MAG: hypothetical protein QF577_03910 [Phycisphaerae bacterium]|jgi:hypothetical protein|nr:hypothetical protein [Phycisphaerae bacterium]